MGLVIRPQPGVGAAARPAGARLLLAARPRGPLAGAALDDRQLFADHAHIGRLPSDLLAGGPQLGSLPDQAVLDLTGRADQVSQQEGHVPELGAHRLDRGEHAALRLFVPGLDRRAEYGAASVDFPQHHRDIGSQASRPLALGGEHLLDAPADFLLKVAAGRLSRRRRRPRASGGAGEHLSQDVSADRGQHPDAGDGKSTGQIDGFGEDRPERRRAQPRQDRLRRDVAPPGAAAPRGPQHPLAQPGLQPLDLIKLAQPGHPPPVFNTPRRAAA